MTTTESWLRGAGLVGFAAALWLTTGCGSGSRETTEPAATDGARAPVGAESNSGTSRESRTEPGHAQAQQVIDYAVTIMRNLSRTINAAGGDCQVMGRALDRWLRVNGGRLDGQVRRAMAIPERTRADLMRRTLGADREVARAMAALHTCRHDPSVAAAAARLVQAP